MCKHTFYSLLSVILLTALTGCADHEYDSRSSTHHTLNHTFLGEGSWGIPDVELKNGNPWKANAATTEGISRMEALLVAFDPKQDNPDTLKSELEHEFDLIFERCTMTGEAHDQLHNYLIPMHKRMSDIELSIGGEREAFENYLKLYPNYFE